MVWVVIVLLAFVSSWAWWKAYRLRRHVERVEREFDAEKQRLTGDLAAVRDRLRHLGGLLLRVSRGRSVSESQALEGAPFEDMSGETAWQLLDTHQKVTILDVRDPHEYAAGHIPGALFIPLGELEQRWREVPRDADFVIVHCAAGSRSAAACEYLRREHEYLNLYNLVRGLSDWPGPLETGGRRV